MDAVVPSTMLIDSVAILAETAARQEAYLRKLGTWPSLDELALEFDDSYPPQVELGREPDFPQTALVRLGLLDRKLTEMSDADPAVWSGAALASDPMWAEVRSLAKAALEALTPVPA